jgi:hypothetical protein
MKRTERQIESAIVTALRLAGWLVMKIPNDALYRKRVPHAQKGAPDLVAVSPTGRVVWIEVKAPRGSVTPHQLALHEALRERGQEVRVARGVNDILDLCAHC